MILVEFTAYWSGDYTKEDRAEYRATYGDTMEDWPKSQVYTPITIDISKTIRFNPADKGKTVVDLCGGSSITLAINYSDYKALLEFNGIKINNSKDAIQNTYKSI